MEKVQKCACGADCEWCVGANKARAAFPKAKKPPQHDGDTEHHCIACFLKLPGLQVRECSARDMEPWESDPNWNPGEEPPQ